MTTLKITREQLVSTRSGSVIHEAYEVAPGVLVAECGRFINVADVGDWHQIGPTCRLCVVELASMNGATA